MANEVKTRARQTTIDIAMQQHGSAEEIFTVAALNGISITDDLRAGDLVQYSEVTVTDVAEYFRKYGPKGTFPASAINTIKRPGGIDFMGIGIDFRIS